MEREKKPERRKKIEESKYKEIYKNIITKEVPIYLWERRKKRERSLIARFRCGNEMRGNQQWRKEEVQSMRKGTRDRDYITYVQGP